MVSQRACSALGVAVAGLVGEQDERAPCSRLGPRQALAERADLDGVAQGRSRAVHADQADCCRVRARRLERRAQQRALRGAVGRREPAGATVLRARSGPLTACCYFKLGGSCPALSASMQK